MTRNRSCDPAEVRRAWDSSIVRVTQVEKPMQ
jgi:hypothetical protein